MNNTQWDELSQLFDGLNSPNIEETTTSPLQTMFGLYLTFYAMILNIYKVN